MSRQLVATSICFSLLLSLLPLRNNCFSAFSGWSPSVWVQYSHGSHLPPFLGHCFLIISSVLPSLSSLFLPLDYDQVNSIHENSFLNLSVTFKGDLVHYFYQSCIFFSFPINTQTHLTQNTLSFSVFLLCINIKITYCIA